MPSVSKKQHNFMAAVANNPSFAKKAEVPQSVGEEFMKADKGRKFGSGSRPDRQGINKPKTDHGKSALFAKGGDMAESKKMVKKEIGFMKKAGAPKSMIKHEMGEMKGKKMAFGGVSNMPTPAKPGVTNKPTQGNRPGRLGRLERKYGPLLRIPEEGMDKPMAKGGKVKKMALGGTAGAKGVQTNAPTPFTKPFGYRSGITTKPTPAKPGVNNKPIKKMATGGGSGGFSMDPPALGVRPNRPNRPNRPTQGAASDNPKFSGYKGPYTGGGGDKFGLSRTFNKGGITSAKMGKVTSGGMKPHGEHTVQAKGKTKGTMVKMAGSKPLGMKYGGKC